MTPAWLLFCGLLALSSGQIIYPDQYERMKTSTFPYTYTNTGRASNSQPLPTATQYEQAFGAEAQAAPIRPSYPSGHGIVLQPSNQAAYQPSSQAAYYPTTPIPSPQPLPQDWNNHVNNIISRGIVKFSLDLDKVIHATRQEVDQSGKSYQMNTIFSPLSIAVALSMVLLGSGGKTFDEVSRVLGLEAGVDISQHSEVLHQMFGLMLAIVNYRVEESKGPRISSGSGIFVQEGYSIRPEFRAISEKAYQSEVINLDFRMRGAEAANLINNWVKNRTNGKISTILSQVPDPLTNVILVSALYFNGEWNQHFLNGATKRRQFFIEPNEIVDVDLMYNGGVFPFYDDRSLGVKIIALPYKGMEVSMYVLLPRAEGAAALRNFSNRLTADSIEYLITNLRNQSCVVGMPRMKLSSSFALKNALQRMGLHSLFDPRSADLSLLSNGYGTQQLPFVTPQFLPQTQSQTLPQTAQTAQQTVPIVTSRPPPLPQPLALTANDNRGKSVNNINERLIFSRVKEDEATNNAKKNYFQFTDKQRGFTVEQWGTGFLIRRPRDTSMTYATTHDKSVHENMNYVSLEKNKYRFRNAAEEKRVNREKRQTRAMDENFVKFLQSQNFPSYQLDNLRNSGQLPNPGLFADEVLHKVEMEVTERGTEAAAATAVLLERDGNQKRLIANRPFLFFIRHDPTKLILFWGAVNTPTPHYATVR